MRTLRS